MDEIHERIDAWYRIASHPFFRGTHAEEGKLIDSMIARLDGLVSESGSRPIGETAEAEEPIKWRLLRAFTNGYVEGMRRGLDGGLDR